VVEINVMHQKIVVIDDHTVLLGSLNTLFAKVWTREVMLVMKGSHFARKILEHEHATDFSSPPLAGSAKARKSNYVAGAQENGFLAMSQCSLVQAWPGKSREPLTQPIKKKGLKGLLFNPIYRCRFPAEYAAPSLAAPGDLHDVIRDAADRLRTS